MSKILKGSEGSPDAKTPTFTTEKLLELSSIRIQEDGSVKRAKVSTRKIKETMRSNQRTTMRSNIGKSRKPTLVT